MSNKVEELYIGCQTVRVHSDIKRRVWQEVKKECFDNPKIFLNRAGVLFENLDLPCNHPDYEGALQWLTTEEFNKQYLDISKLSFSFALHYLIKGYKVTLSTWENKYLMYNANEAKIYLYERDSIKVWVPKQKDILLEQWTIVR